MELPVKEIVFVPGKNPKFGVFANSSVNQPAIEEDSVFFNKETNTMFTINEESRIIFGPVLIPNKMIFRDNGKEQFNLFATKETIEAIAIDFAANGRFNNVNLDHADELVNDVVIFQSFVTNKNTVPSVKGWEHLEEGTLFQGAKVYNDDVWQGIKDGKYNGWSIHAYLEQNYVDLSLTDNEITTLLKKVFSNEIN